MPVSSSSGLDIDLVFSNAAASSASSSSSSSSHPWIPPRSQWPLPGEDDAAAGDDDDDGDDWGPSTSASKSRWLTAMTSWSSRREDSGNSEARMAIATADGSVHFLTQEHQRPSPPSRNSPTRSSRTRSPSPTPSIASTRSGFHPRADSHAPPFAGFASHEGSSATMQEHILSPTSPTSTNLASTAAWKPSSPEGNRQQGFDALESRLESQYHSGSAAMGTSSSATHSHHRGESVVGSFMESLGLSKSAAHHHHASPSRSRRDSSTATASASAEMSRTSSSSRTTGPTTSSNTQLTPPPAAASPSSSRRHSHARSSAIIGSSSAMAALHAPSSGSAGGSVGEEMKRSRSVSQATAGSSSRRRGEDVADSPSANQSPAAPAILEKIRPYARLASNGRDGSQVVAMATCCLSGDSKDGSQPDTLLFLHRSGWMTAVSLHDGTVLGDIDLASAYASIPAEQAPVAAAAAAGGSTSTFAGAGGNGGGGLVASTLAALRSHSNSPAPAAAGPAHARLQQQQQQQQPTSRPGSASLLRRALTNEPAPAASGAGASQAATRPPQQQQGKQRACSFTPALHVTQSAEGAPVAVCYDAAQKLLVFVALQAAPGRTASLRVVEVVHLPEASRERAPSVVVGHEPAGCCVAYLDEVREAVVMQKYEVKSGSAIVRASSSKLALPDSLTVSVQSCALLDAKRMLLRMADESVVLLKVAGGGEGEILEVIKSLRVAELEEVEVVAGSAGAVDFALARTKASTRLLRIAEDDLALLEHEASVNVATSLPCGPSSTLLTASASEAGLQITSLNSTASMPQPRQLYTSTSSTPALQGLLPLSMERILVLTSSGHLLMTTLNDLVTGGGQVLAKTPDTPPCTAAAAPNARLTMFRMISNPSTTSSSSTRPTSSSSSTHKYILTTFSTGSLAFWDPTTLRLIAEWSLFTTPVAPHSLALFGNNDNTLRLHNCLALASTDGSLALIALDGLKLLYLIPGRGREAPLVRLAVRADELMLLYADGRARVWDVASMELRRSVSSEQAGGMLVDGRGSWSVFEMGEQGCAAATQTQTQSGVLSAVQPSTAGVGVGIMRANVKRAIDAAYKAATNGSTTGSGSAAVKDGASTLPLPRPRAVRPSASSATIGSTSSASGGAARVQTILRPLMTALWPWGVDEEMDAAVKGLFDPPLQTGQKSSTGSAVVGTGLGSASVGEGRRHYQVLPGKEGDELTVSGVTNATRFLALVAMLDVLFRARGAGGKGPTAKDDGATSRLTTWLSTTLSSSVAGLAPLNPAVLALHLVDPTPSIRSAATLLLEKRIEGMDPQEVEGLVDGPGSWRALLPTVSTAAAAGQRRAQALALIGFLCLKRYAALDPALLRDGAENVAYALSPSLTLAADHASQQQLRLIALHLCVQGFAIWQNYVDAMALLRALFALAVDNTEGGEGSEVQLAARQAVVQVAEEHAPLFMTTLNLDLLAAGAAGTDSGASNVATTSASGAQQAMRTMRLLTFLVGQRPGLLVASLPRIAEAVVKALDPTISASPGTATASNTAAASSTSSPKTSTTIPLPSSATTTTQRDLLLPTATALISSLVRTYRTLAFHGPTQRLAVGTHEGAIVMYELRSATRLFVLEGGHGHGHGQHRAAGMAVGAGHHSGGHAPTAAGPLTMLSFSPDGRRLISLSLSEGKALAWKVGSSLASWLLRPGGVPRQGGGSTSTGSASGAGTAGADPAYKVWRFRPFAEGERGVEVDVDVRCEWVAEKRCEVEIVAGAGEGRERRERTLWDVE